MLRTLLDMTDCWRSFFVLMATAVFACISQNPAIAAEPVASPGIGQTDLKNRSAFSNRGMTAGRTAEQPAIQQRGFFDRSWALVLHWQQRINRSLTEALRRFKTHDVFTASALLILLSFTYGVLHAVGPGHGKIVVSSYVLANERTVRRGIAVAFLAALFQAMSAIIIVSVMAVALNRTGMEIRATESWITTLSWGLVAAIGGVLLYGQLAKIFRNPVTANTHTHPENHSDPNHVHDENCGCGHNHMPAAEQLKGAWSWRQALTLALAVGIRPCTGAVLVLIFALTQDLFVAGIFATFAMALGTAITVSALAALAVGSREMATRYSGENSVWAGRVQTAAGFIGASLLLVLGLTFFIASLGPARPF